MGSGLGIALRFHGSEHPKTRPKGGISGDEKKRPIVRNAIPSPGHIAKLSYLTLLFFNAESRKPFVKIFKPFNEKQRL